MQVPMEISYHGVVVPAALERRLRREAARLDRFADGIVSCRVAVEQPSRRRRSGRPYRVRLSVTLPPNKDLVVSRTGSDDRAPDPLLGAVRGTFQAMERKLKRTNAVRRGRPAARAWRARERRAFGTS
jgi:hypothetical protein